MIRLPGRTAVAEGVKASVYKLQGLSPLRFESRRGRPHVRKDVFLVVGPYWLAQCQYNVTEWLAMLICDIVGQCASTLKAAISAI